MTGRAGISLFWDKEMPWEILSPNLLCLEDGGRALCMVRVWTKPAAICQGLLRCPTKRALKNHFLRTSFVYYVVDLYESWLGLRLDLCGLRLGLGKGDSDSDSVFGDSSTSTCMVCGCSGDQSWSLQTGCDLLKLILIFASLCACKWWEHFAQYIPVPAMSGAVCMLKFCAGPKFSAGSYFVLSSIWSCSARFTI